MEKNKPPEGEPGIRLVKSNQEVHGDSGSSHAKPSKLKTGLQAAAQEGRAPSIEEIFEEIKAVTALTLTQLRTLGNPARTATSLGHLVKAANAVMAAEQFKAISGEFTADMSHQDIRDRAEKLIESLKKVV